MSSLVLAQQATSGSSWFCCYMVAGLIGLYVLIKVLTAKPTVCDVCDGSMGRNAYSWRLDGKQRWLCANCNRRLADHQSRVAVNRVLGRDQGDMPPAGPAASAARASARPGLVGRAGDVIYRSLLAFLVFLIVVIYGSILATKLGYL